MGIPFFILTVAEGFTDFVPGMSGVRCDVIRDSVKKTFNDRTLFSYLRSSTNTSFTGKQIIQCRTLCAKEANP